MPSNIDGWSRTPGHCLRLLPSVVRDTFEKGLTDTISLDDFHNIASRDRNTERSRVVSEVLEQHLIPVATKWIREYPRKEVEELPGSQVQRIVSKVDVTPYTTRPLGEGGYSSSVLATSQGKGDPHKDTILTVYLDEAGRMREHTKIDNLHDVDLLDEFFDSPKRRRPDVIGISGFGVATVKLVNRMKTLLKGSSSTVSRKDRCNNQQFLGPPGDHVRDEVARIYQHGKRVSGISPIATGSSAVKQATSEALKLPPTCLHSSTTVDALLNI